MAERKAGDPDPVRQLAQVAGEVGDAVHHHDGDLGGTEVQAEPVGRHLEGPMVGGAFDEEDAAGHSATVSRSVDRVVRVSDDH